MLTLPKGLLRSTKNAFIVQSKSRFLDYVFIDSDLAPPKTGANDVIAIDHVHCF